jgi:hypothetical protein
MRSSIAEGAIRTDRDRIATRFSCYESCDGAVFVLRIAFSAEAEKSADALGDA